MLGRVIAVANQKGGVGKTTTSINLSACLAQSGKRVLAVDIDPQGNCTSGLGLDKNSLQCSIYDLLMGQCYTEDAVSSTLIEDLFIIPSNIELSTIENALLNSISRENILKKLLSGIKNDYDFIVIDTMPSLNFMTINAMNAADSVLIPMQPQYFSAKGLELLLSTIASVKKNLNRKLKIDGILMTMYDSRLNFHKEIFDVIFENYGKNLKIFETKIPISIRVTEMQARSQSVFDNDPTSKISENYAAFTNELINGGKQI